MLVIDMLDNLFLQALAGETEQEWRAWVEGALRGIYGNIPTWLHFEAGPAACAEGELYRSYRCAAGSVGCFLWRAAEDGSLDRSLIQLGRTHPDGRLTATRWTAGKLTAVDGEGLVQQVPSILQRHPNALSADISGAIIQGIGIAQQSRTGA